VGTGSEFSNDASGWRWQRAGASTDIRAAGRAFDDGYSCAESADPPISGRDVLPAAERQGPHTGRTAADGDARAVSAARGHRHQFTAPDIRRADRRSHTAVSAAQTGARKSLVQSFCSGRVAVGRRAERCATGRAADDDRADKPIQWFIGAFRFGQWNRCGTNSP
jgi:hypothetical protein